MSVMLTPNQISEIEERLERGETPAEIAGSMGIGSQGGLIYKLLKSGKRIKTIRVLEDVLPVQAGEEVELAGAA